MLVPLADSFIVMLWTDSIISTRSFLSLPNTYVFLEPHIGGHEPGLSLSQLFLTGSKVQGLDVKGSIDQYCDHVVIMTSH